MQPVDHVEAGLRSFDRNMPEEVNRVVTDHLSDLLFCPTSTAVANLAAEGVHDGVLLVGDVMLDLAIQTRPAALARPLPIGLRDGEYFVATIHRPANTDDEARIAAIFAALGDVARRVGPVVVPTHPRLSKRIRESGVAADGIRTIAPVGYVDMQALLLRARGVITDSGGVQKEALFHGVRCITLRDSTEWVESIQAGMNELLGDRLADLPSAAERCVGRETVEPSVWEGFGGGRAGDAIAQAIAGAGNTRQRWRR
jgi:UDP-N-acetylglucosamine 2-epimerase